MNIVIAKQAISLLLFYDKLIKMSSWKNFTSYFQRVEGVILLLASLVTSTYAVYIISPFFDLEVDAYFSFAGLAFLNLAAAVLGLRIFLSNQFHPRWKWGWFFIALAASANVIAEFLWFYTSEVLGIEPYPSIADIFYLLYYPLVLVGVTIMPFERQRKGERLVFILDLLIVLVFGAMILWNFILITDSNGLQQTWASFFAFSYPVGDLLLLAGILAILQRDTEPNARWSLVYLALSLGVMALADFLFAFFESLGISYSISPINALFMVSALFLVYSAARLSQMLFVEDQPISPIFDTSRRLLRLGLPYVAAVMGPILLFYVAESSGQINLRLRILLLGTAFLVCLVMVRQYLVLAENDRLYREMRHLATTDSLTGAYNRHFFHESLVREIQRAHRYKKTFSVLIIDVDDFKLINDRLGHLQGDAVLNQISRVLTVNLRKSDFLARFGGDEFVIVLPETDLPGAQVVKDKICRAVAESPIINPPLTISVGLATYQPSMSPEQLLEQADLSLYQFKRARSKPSHPLSDH